MAVSFTAIGDSRDQASHVVGRADVHQETIYFGWLVGGATRRWVFSLGAWAGYSAASRKLFTSASSTVGSPGAT